MERIDARLLGEEVRPLRKLEGALVFERASQFHSGLPGPGEDLPRYKEGHQPELNLLERHLPRDQISLVASVAHAVEVGVVLEDGDGPAGRLRAPPRALQHDPLARPVMRYQITKGPALRRRVFGVPMVVV